MLGNVATQIGARTITIDKKNHKLYLPTAEFGETPEKTAENPTPCPSIKQNSFVILVIEIFYAGDAYGLPQRKQNFGAWNPVCCTGCLCCCS